MTPMADVEKLTLCRLRGGALGLYVTAPQPNNPERRVYGDIEDALVWLVGFATMPEADAYTLGLEHANVGDVKYWIEQIADDLFVVIVEWGDDESGPGIEYHDMRSSGR